MAEKEYISLLSLNEDTEELSNYNPEADANASVPPFPAGIYPCVVTFGNENLDEIWEPGVAKDGQKFLKTMVKATLYGTPEGAFDGRSVTHHINTYTSKFSNTNSVQALLQGLGLGEDIRAVTARGPLAKALTDALAGGNATAEGVFDWEARYAPEDPPDSGVYPELFRKSGMKKFVQLPDGSYDPECDYKGIPVMARNILVKWVNPDKEKTAGAAQGKASAPAAAVGQSGPPRAAATQAAPSPAPAAAQAQSGPPVPPRAARQAPARAGAPVPAGQR